MQYKFTIMSLTLEWPPDLCLQQSKEQIDLVFFFNKTEMRRIFFTVISIIFLPLLLSQAYAITCIYNRGVSHQNPRTVPKKLTSDVILRKHLKDCRECLFFNWIGIIQSNLDISNSDISYYAKLGAFIWIKNTFWLLSLTIIWRWRLFYKSKLPEVQINLHFR